MKTIQVTLPKAWNELNSRQLQRLALLFNTVERGQLFDIAIFHILMDVEVSFKKALQAKAILRDVPVSELKKHYKFIYAEANRTVFLKTMKADGQMLHAPADRLTNLSADEFANAEGLHQIWYKEKHRRALEFMAALLYTTGAGARPEFKKADLEINALRFTKVPLPELLAMEMAYSGCKNAIVKKFPIAFPQSTKAADNANKGYGFGKVILNMSGGKFGAYDQTRGTNIYTFMEEFQENLKAAKNAK